MAGTDPNDEWLGYVQPVGLVVAPVVLGRYGLTPAIQTKADTDAARAFIAPKPEDGKANGAGRRALADPWAFFAGTLGWRAAQVHGAPGGQPVPEDLFLKVEESDTEIGPDWAVRDPDGGWQALARIEPEGVKAEERGALAGWEATAQQRFERLLREKQIPVGIQITDDELRVIHAPRGETSGWLTFPLRSLAEVGGRPMLGGLKLLLSSFRLHNDAPEKRLPGLVKASREAQAEVSTRLAAQVLGALHELLRGLHAADRARIETLAAEAQEHLYDGLLVVLLRLVFLLYAEDRDLIPSRTDAEARAFYAQGYGVRSLYAQLLDDRARHPDTMDERRGAWSRLLALFSLVHHGDRTGWVRGRGGRLFDPAVYPFLQGQEKAGDAPAPAPVSDGCILRILDALITVDGEKLSYRTLDVEQIGSVYETVMGFTIETRAGPAVAIKAGKNDRTPVFVDLAALVAAKGTERAKFLKEQAGRNAVPDKVAKPLAAAKGADEALAALRGIVDERGSPGGQVSPPGTPLLQPTDERRRTGSHYTPRSLTQPIVQHALQPAFERMGRDAKPEDVLALKICDPAMGSGAFLVEACRALGDRLVEAWRRWPETRPRIPDDEDEPLHARRLVAQRCLYGVDKNPRAVELAKLSLWLATLARDHEFTFLDHELKCGDSLVGLDAEQIAAMNWDLSKPGLPLFRKFVADRVAEATKARARIQSAPDDTERWILEGEYRDVENIVADVRTLGDAVISAFFAEDKSKAREKRRATIESWVSGSPIKWGELRGAAASLRTETHQMSPFHWTVEFPEVFVGKYSGFHAIMGNPPFAGRNTIIASHAKQYLPWLQAKHEGAHGNSDLVAHFFRLAFNLLCRDGVFGLIATNTIAQGDTRDTGLACILEKDGAIAYAKRRLKWPGDAAVVVSIVHCAKGEFTQPRLDDRPVSRISAYLVAGHLDRSPKPLLTNSGIVFEGSKTIGIGFTFDDAGFAQGITEDIETMQRLITADSRNRNVIFPYIGGEEVNTSPNHAYNRYAIDFFDRPLRRERAFHSWFDWSDERKRRGLREGEVPQDYPGEVAEDYPDLLDIVRKRVKPTRDAQSRAALRQRWWQYGEKRPGLYKAIHSLSRTLVVVRVSPHLCITFLPTGYRYSDQLDVVASDKGSILAMLQARVHELWARFFASSMKDDLRYTPSECFEAFPFPTYYKSLQYLDSIGESYFVYRSTSMQGRNEGMTKTYNRFHDADEQSADIVRLRELHADMDRAVLRAYAASATTPEDAAAWNGLADRAEPIFLDETNEDDHTYQGRLFWPSAFRDEVLARLLALNAERAAAEQAAGLAPLTLDEEEKQEVDP